MDEILLTATPEPVRLMGVALDKMAEAANSFGDESIIGGVTWNITEVENDEN